jgi:hypothetical protein
MIPAEVHSDDFVHQVQFDAEKWFGRASAEEIIDLAQCGWGGDYAADEVAQFMEDQNPEIAALLEHCRSKVECGFECHIQPFDALNWLKHHRPALAAMLHEC